MTLFLVRHGRPVVDLQHPAAEWILDPQGIPAISRLRGSDRLPHPAHWFSSPEPKAFDRPTVPAWPGWEPIADCRARVSAAVRGILAAVASSEDPDGDVVLVGHGTAWTVLMSELTGRPPDLDRWRAMTMPDVMTIAVDELG